MKIKISNMCSMFRNKVTIRRTHRMNYYLMSLRYLHIGDLGLSKLISVSYSRFCNYYKKHLLNMKLFLHSYLRSKKRLDQDKYLPKHQSFLLYSITTIVYRYLFITLKRCTSLIRKEIPSNNTAKAI